MAAPSSRITGADDDAAYNLHTTTRGGSLAPYLLLPATRTRGAGVAVAADFPQDGARAAGSARFALFNNSALRLLPASTS